MGVPASEAPRIGECPNCEALEVPVILTETNQVLCSACGEDIGKPAVVEGPGYDSLWHLHPHSEQVLWVDVRPHPLRDLVAEVERLRIDLAGSVKSLQEVNLQLMQEVTRLRTAVREFGDERP